MEPRGAGPSVAFRTRLESIKVENIASLSNQEIPRGYPLEGGDILHGVKKIAEYMRELGFEMTERRCFDWVAAGRIPYTKVGVGIISRKSAIRERFLEAIK
jgi:hypothetical protein